MGSFGLSRRSLLMTLPCFAFSPGLLLSETKVTPEEQFKAIEKGIGGRLGVAALNTGTGLSLGYRSAELFPMCSTFKFLLAACILRRVESGSEQMDRTISFTGKDLLGYAPVTRSHLHQGAITVYELCAAAVEVSDNTAANLLLAQIGGPIGLTKFIRSLGDQVTRLDRTEPELNSAVPGDPRDTTSPDAMLGSMGKLLNGNALTASSRTQLTVWLEQSTTGTQRLRAGVPADWRGGDKTGTGEHGAMGDIGIFGPPGQKPILSAAYQMEGQASTDQREQAIAAVGRVVAQKL